MKTLLFLLLIIPFCVHAQIITTYAGNGIGGTLSGDGGPATNAAITTVYGLSFDDTGNLLICQEDLIRKVNKSTNIIHTIAGSDTATSAGGGGDGGPALAAGISEPYGICVDSADNYYIADRWLSEIRIVYSSTDIIDTFAGDRTGGGSGNGGPAKSAELNDPVGVCFDPAQHYLYISNEFGYTVRKVDMLTDIISAYAGTGVNGYSGDGGLAINAKFSRVLGICSDASGNIYIGDWDNARIRKVDAMTGIVTTIAGNGTVGYSGDGGLATNAMIDRPAGICFDKCDNLYFSMEDSNCVRRIDAVTGIINTVAGNGIQGFAGDGGPATNAELNNPVGVAIDSSGNLYIGDQLNNRVRKVTIFNPFIRILVTSGDTVCSGEPVTIQATLAGGGITPTFQWVVNGIVMSGTTSSSYTYIPANGDSVSCILTSSSACVGNLTATSNTIHLVTTTSVAPSVSISSTSVNDTVCAGTMVVFSASPSVGGASPAYQWVVDGTITGTSSSTYTYTPANGDSIRCILTSSAACAVPATASSNTIDMVANPVMTPTITLTGNTPAAIGSIVTVNALIAGAGSSYSINWYYNGAPFLTTTVPQITYSKTAGIDNITATVIPSSIGMLPGCYDSSTSGILTIEATSGISNLNATNAISIYPNPAHDVLTIEAANNIAGVTISDLVGVELRSFVSLRMTSIQIDISDLRAGVYVVAVTDEEGNKTVHKIVKE